MALNHTDVTERRADFSRFMVHLTRDDSGEINGASARENFENILTHGQILALRPHCLHRYKVPRDYRKLFNVACFTETPLDQIEHLVAEISGRRINLEPYGFVFTREFLLRNGAQQAINVSSYSGTGQIDSFNAIFEMAVAGKFRGRSWKILPFVNVMRDDLDFSWEREWRIRGALNFTSDDLQHVILPEDADDELKESLARRAISYITVTSGFSLCDYFSHPRQHFELTRVNHVLVLWQRVTSHQNVP